MDVLNIIAKILFIGLLIYGFYVVYFVYKTNEQMKKDIEDLKTAQSLETSTLADEKEYCKICPNRETCEPGREPCVPHVEQVVLSPEDKQ